VTDHRQKQTNAPIVFVHPNPPRLPRLRPKNISIDDTDPSIRYSNYPGWSTDVWLGQSQTQATQSAATAEQASLTRSQALLYGKQD
jgi:hypothetical protein